MTKQPPQPLNRAPSPALQRAAAALQMGQLAEAERLASEVLKASRSDVTAASILARALIGQNRNAEAIAPLERIARKVEDSGIETLLGAALGGGGRRSEAIDLLRRTVQRQPPFLPAFQELAGQLSAAGHLDEAIDLIARALTFAPSALDLQLTQARLLLHRNERGRARSLLEAMNTAAPGHPEILTTLARARLLEGDYAAAADIYRHMLALRPDDALMRADLSACLLEMGDRDTGEAHLRQAMRGRPQMIGRATYALVQSSHGRFFFRPSGFAKFLSDGS